MWTRSLLKTNAKRALSGRYWRCLALCLLISLLGIGFSGNGTMMQWNINTGWLNSALRGPVWHGNVSQADLLEWYLLSMPLEFWNALLIGALIGLVLGAAYVAFVYNPVLVGRNRYFMESRQAPSPFSTVTSVFGSGYFHLVKVMFLVRLKILLGCLLIVPGIYWAFCYHQVPYLLAENPYLSTGRAMQLSREMMRGEKWKTFVLHLSFLGWQILCALSFGIGYVFLEPYIQATFSELYAALRAKALVQGLSDESELGGFVRH